ncbi:hypothetical protein G6F70_004813 [Rhizopus microsporus]|nr:hypothetical protein G6F70_004813 [Rhizopus microsporus]
MYSYLPAVDPVNQDFIVLRTERNPDIYSLDLYYSSPVSVNIMNLHWKNVPLNNLDPERRVNPQFIVLSDNRRLFIDSGYAMHLINHTIVFDSYDNTWQKLPDFSGEKQRTDGRAVAVSLDTGDTVIIFGSETVKVFPMVIGNKTVESHVGLPLLNCTIYHTSSQIWAYLSRQINAPLDKIPYEHSATFHPSSGIIYYFGGRNCDSKDYATVASFRWGSY